MKLLSIPALALILFHKPIVEKYEGGSAHHSHLILTLFQDSTFTYSTWYHSSPKKVSTYRGIWHKTPGRLVLDSKRKDGVFHNEFYRLERDTLYMYTKEDSIKSYSFYKEYHTLARKL